MGSVTSPLRTVRTAQGISTDDLALAMGVKPPTINRIENARFRPSPDLANRIAKYFGNKVTRDQILFPEDYMRPPRKASRRALEKVG